MTKALTLSVVMPNFNHGAFIGGALRAVLGQTFAPLEVLVADDGSADDSVAVVQRFVERDRRVRLLRNDCNLGFFFTMDRLLKEARGEYVYGGAADDRVLPGLFEKSMGLLARHPRAAICCTDPGWIHPATGEVTATRLGWSQVPRYFSPAQLARVINGEALYGHTCIFRRSALEEAGGFLPELAWHCDWFAFLVIAFRTGACYIPEPLAALRQEPTSYSLAGSSQWASERGVLDHILRVVKDRRYRDVYPYFVRGDLLARFGPWVGQVAWENPEHWDVRTLRVAWTPLRQWAGPLLADHWRRARLAVPRLLRRWLPHPVKRAYRFLRGFRGPDHAAVCGPGDRGAALRGPTQDTAVEVRNGK
jgi:glycosyltransferase involved in cell wall biosynthesis